MRPKHIRTTAEKLMIGVLWFAIFLMTALAVFDVESMATHEFDRRTGTKALVGSAIFILICYRALRKRIDDASN